jgi:hypothetical protein
MATNAKENGLFTSFMQPWHISIIDITIVGESYLGAYPFFSRGDKDIENILGMFRQSHNDFILGKPGTKERVILSIANNPGETDEYIGYINSLEFSDKITTVFTLPYTLSFSGWSRQSIAIQNGKNAASATRIQAGG